MMYGYGNDMTWWMVVYSIVWIALIGVGIAALVVWIRRSAVPAGSSSARHILEERYARGEIDDEEFQRRTKTIS